jgi:hypothetical protein
LYWAIQPFTTLLSSIRNASPATLLNASDQGGDNSLDDAEDGDIGRLDPGGYAVSPERVGDEAVVPHGGHLVVGDYDSRDSVLVIGLLGEAGRRKKEEVSRS